MVCFAESFTGLSGQRAGQNIQMYPGPNCMMATGAPSHVHNQGWFSWMWPDSALLDAALSTLVGIVYGHLLLGPALNSTNLTWLKGDPAQYYIGWALFAQTPGCHWPLTFTDRIGYPIGDAIANVDPNPLAALLLRHSPSCCRLTFSTSAHGQCSALRSSSISACGCSVSSSGGACGRRYVEAYC